MGILNDSGLIKGELKMAASLFETLFPNFMEVKYSSPSDYVKKYWAEYIKKSSGSSLNGNMFELILSTLFIRENLLPLYIGARVAFVPNVIYDLMLYTLERGPVCISAKTSLRERYKQADLEAIALKYVHRKSLCYLITLDIGEAKNVSAKIKSGDVIGLDDVIVATETEFDLLIKNLKKLEYSEAGSVDVIKSLTIIRKP